MVAAAATLMWRVPVARADDLVAVEPGTALSASIATTASTSGLRAGEVVRGAHGGGDRDALDLLDLAREERSPAESQAGPAALRTAGNQHLSRGARWAHGAPSSSGAE